MGYASSVDDQFLPGAWKRCPGLNETSDAKRSWNRYIRIVKRSMVLHRPSDSAVVFSKRNDSRPFQAAGYKVK
jgi:hypothetical protein